MTSQEQFNAAVMNWISEATSVYQTAFEGSRAIMSNACMRCWTAYGKNTTNLDAVPAARVSDTDEDLLHAASLSGKTPDEASRLVEVTGNTFVLNPQPDDIVPKAIVGIEITQDGQIAKMGDGKTMWKNLLPLSPLPQIVLTAAEREAIEAAAWACGRRDGFNGDPRKPAIYKGNKIEAVLRGLLERAK